MSRGRTPRNAIRRQTLLSRAVDSVERLEERRMLTTLQGGESFQYLDANKNTVRITLTGDIIAEFTAARVRSTNNSVVIRDLIPSIGPGGTQNTDGADLFNIYIAQAGPDAAIYISQVPNTEFPVRDATPFDGTVGDIRAFSAETDGSNDDGTVTPDAAGGVYIGARTVDINSNITTESDIPIIRQPYRGQLGVRPASKGIFAGIESAPGVSLNKLYVGGTITGLVNIEGSVGTFYAGNVLTGDASGLGIGQRTTITNNFTIGGDLQNFYVSGSVGSNATGNFRTGVNMRIGGKLGYMNVANTFGASLQVRASPSGPALTTPSQEAEYILQTQLKETVGGSFFNGLLSGDQFNNDTQNQQGASSFGNDEQMSWSGTLQGLRTTDFTDTYSLPLLAGQSAAVQLSGLGLNVGVFDPLGRLVATDLSGPTGGATNEQFQFVAKLPGVYTLTVAFANNTSFLSTVAGNPRGTVPYVLTATGTGTLNLGVAEVTGLSRFREPGNGVALRTGDLGAWLGRGDVTGSTVYQDGSSSPINISRGNLRALYGNNIGREIPIETTEYLNLVVPNGSVGYIKAAEDMVINPDAQDPLSGDPVASAAIGGGYQRVEAGGDVDSNLVANGSIGTIVAGGIQSNTTESFNPIFSVNTDGRGSDGTIDMIYVTGDVGTSGNVGGPGLYTGLNGNVKYFHVDGTLVRDAFFAGIPTSTTYGLGEVARLQDDSGAQITITPTATTTTTSVTDPTTGQPVVLSSPGRLTLVTYPVRGTGGVVIVSAESTSSLTAVSSGTGGSVDLTEVITNSDGSPVFRDGATVGYTKGDVAPTSGTTTVVDPVTGAVTNVFSRTPSRPNPILFGGSLPVNVMHVVGNDVTSLVNGTAGEIASANVTSLGVLSAQTVGKINASTATDVVVPTNLTDTGGPAPGTDIPTGGTGSGAAEAFPFDAFSRGIDVTGSAVSIFARDGTGSILVGQTLGALNPNSDGKNAAGRFDGIGGPVQADVFASIGIGEGVAFGGTGALANAGIFAVESIVNLSGVNADIRGPVVSARTIGTISLNNGSIVNTAVGTFTSFDQVLYTVSSTQVNDPNGAFALSNLTITGNGGILGSTLAAGSFGQVNVGGYGILDTNIFATATGTRNGSITAGGLGIRFSNINIGSSIGSVNATGNGRVLSIASFNPTVQQTGAARRRRFDAYSGRTLSGANDLNRLFGTTRSSPTLSGATNAGVIQDTTIVGLGDLGSVNAYAIGSANTERDIGSSLFPMRIVFANSIGTVTTTSSITGLQLRSGSLAKLNVGANLQRASIGIAGTIGDISVGKTLRGTATILAQGGNGSINSIVVRGGLYGTVNANRSIGTIAADVIGSTIATGGSIQKLLADNDILSGSNIRAGKTIGRAIIGRNFEDGATIDSSGIDVFRVGGTNAGTVIKH